MVGAICKREVLFHPWLTIECFGWAVFFRAIFSGRDRTFLSLLQKAGALGRPQVPLPDTLVRCTALERRAMWIYRSFAVRYARLPRAREFFEDLAQQEETHAELLELCQAAAGRGHWKGTGVEPWQQGLPTTEQFLTEVEAGFDHDVPLGDALRLVIRLESSQINGLFTNAVRTTDPRFAEVFRAFRTAVREHLTYIRQRIPLLEPKLQAECDAIQIDPE